MQPSSMSGGGTEKSYGGWEGPETIHMIYSETVDIAKETGGTIDICPAENGEDQGRGNGGRTGDVKKKKKKPGTNRLANYAEKEGGSQKACKIALSNVRTPKNGKGEEKKK